MTPAKSSKLNIRSMATLTSIDSVRRKIQTLQQATHEAEEQAELLREEADMERQARERVILRNTVLRPLHRKLQSSMNGCFPFVCKSGNITIKNN